jgi:hypothetical protein
MGIAGLPKSMARLQPDSRRAIYRRGSGFLFWKRGSLGIRSSSSTVDFIAAWIGLIAFRWVKFLRKPENDSAWSEEGKQSFEIKSGILEIGKTQREAI